MRLLYIFTIIACTPLITLGGLESLPFGLRSGITMREAKVELSKRKVIAYNSRYSDSDTLNYDVKGIVFNEIKMTDFNVYFSSGGELVFASIRGNVTTEGQEAYNTIVKLFKFCKEQGLELDFQTIDDLDNFDDLDEGSVAVFKGKPPIKININTEIVNHNDKDYYRIELQWIDFAAGQRAIDKKASDGRKKNNDAVDLLE
tara:strand:- start:189 stop:791 length:603 start_codon:yes stop_codon:yes gene_type:complete